MNQDIISRIDAILNPAAPAPTEPAPAPPEPETPESGEPQPETEGPPNPLVEGDDWPPEAPVEPPKTAEIPLEQLEAIALDVTFKGEDGSDVTQKLTIKELREGVMRQKDYQRKTAEVARQRDEVGEKVRQAIDSERNGYQQNLQQLQNVVLEGIAPELKDVNWNYLAANDPAEYIRLRNRADQIKEVLGTIQSKTQEVKKKQDEEIRQATLKAARESRNRLESDIPGFDDTLYKTLLKSGEPYGYKPEELAQWVDHRAIKLLHDAYQFQKLKADKPVIEKKVVNVPKVVKPGAIPPAKPKDADGVSALQKSGKWQDAADIIRARM